MLYNVVVLLCLLGHTPCPAFALNAPEAGSTEKSEGDLPEPPIHACEMRQRGFHILQRKGCGVNVWRDSLREAEPLRVGVTDCPADYAALIPLVERVLALKPREMYQQPWRYFGPQGQHINGPAAWAHWLRLGPIFLLEGGQFQWPPVHVGFRHHVNSTTSATSCSGVGECLASEVEIETLALQPPIFRVKNLMSLEEGAALIQYMRPRMRTSGVVSMNRQFSSGYRPRTSTDYRPAHNETPLLAALEARTAFLVKAPHSHLENAQLVYYETGGYYHAHDDAGRLEFYWKDRKFLMKRHYGHFSRALTLFWYLNSVPRGGGTNFPRADTDQVPKTMKRCEQGLIVQPKVGTAVLWYNLDPSGWVNPLALHAACVVEEGEKYAMNIWVRNKPSNTPDAHWDPRHPRLLALQQNDEL